VTGVLWRPQGTQDARVALSCPLPGLCRLPSLCILCHSRYFPEKRLSITQKFESDGKVGETEHLDLIRIFRSP